jgi:DNA-binding IclR family transcriptional regulator
MPDDELDDPFSANPTLKMQIQRFLRDLERKGLVRRNGRFRNGQPVYIRSSRTSISSCRSAKISADKYPIFTPKLLRDLVERTRKIGYALIEALVVPGSYGIGVAVPDNRGQPLAALSIAAIASRMTPARQQELVAAMDTERDRLRDAIERAQMLERHDPERRIGKRSAHGWPANRAKSAAQEAGRA